jgi:hypothetical protein
MQYLVAPMKRNKRRTAPAMLIGTVLFLLIHTFSPLAADAADMQLEALLVWGTNQQKSPDPKHKPVSADLKKQLQQLPLKWTNYFEVNRVKFSVPSSGTSKVPLSEKCAIDVKNHGHDRIEVAVFGKGKQIATRNQELPKQGTLVLGGDSPGTNCWLAVIKRVD